VSRDKLLVLMTAIVGIPLNMIRLRFRLICPRLQSPSFLLSAGSSKPLAVYPAYHSAALK
ncbi:hypothetical protein OZ833_004125, partial [Yersinia enterocolitica]